MNWDLIFMILAVGLVLLFLAPFAMAIILSYHKAKAKIIIEVLTASRGRDDDLPEDWSSMFNMKDGIQ